MRYRRNRGTGAAEHIIEFERLYQSAVDHGLALNPSMLSALLIESAQLTESQEQWILQSVAADYSRYPQIRQAMRRLPNLDSRHNSDAQHWPVLPEPHQSEADPGSWTDSSQHYSPWNSDGALNQPLPEPADENYWPTETVEDDDMYSCSDDYCSTGPSAADEEEYYALQSAWAFVKRTRHKGMGREREGERAKEGARVRIKLFR
jgi:hypothetical protein